MHFLIYHENDDIKMGLPEKVNHFSATNPVSNVSPDVPIDFSQSVHKFLHAGFGLGIHAVSIVSEPTVDLKCRSPARRFPVACAFFRPLKPGILAGEKSNPNWICVLCRHVHLQARGRKCAKLNEHAQNSCVLFRTFFFL